MNRIYASPSFKRIYHGNLTQSIRCWPNATQKSYAKEVRLIRTSNERLVFSRQHSTATPSSSSPASSHVTKAKSASSGSKLGDYFADHAGKVALGALGIAAGLVYTYFLSQQNKSEVESSIENHFLTIEPYELLELRYFNDLSESSLKQIVLKLFQQQEKKESSIGNLSNFPFLT